MAQQPSTPRKRHRLTKPIRASVVALIVGLFSLPADTLSGQEDVSAAIVRLTATTTDGYSKTGSGFVVALQAGTANVVTAAHVVTGSQNVVAEFSTDLSGAYKAEVFRVDSKIDLALLRISNPPAATKALLISDRSPKPGAAASVVGFPQRAPKPRFAAVTLSSQEGSRLSLTGLVDSGSSGSPVLQGDVVVALVTEVEGMIYPFAVSGPTLRLVLESWLSVALPKPSETPGRRIGLTVTDLEGIPVQGIELSRSNVVADPTSETGFTQLLLDSKELAGAAIRLELPASWALEWMLINRQVNVPHKDEPETVQVVAIRRDQFRMIATGALNKLSQVQRQEAMTQEQKRQIIADFAEERGLTELQLEQATLSFAETDSLLDQGLAKLLVGAYFEAGPLLRASLEEGQLKIELGQVLLEEGRKQAAESARNLGHALCYAGQYEDSIAAYRKALEYRPNDSLLLSDLALPLSRYDPHEAELLSRKSVQISVDQKGAQHLATAQALNSLAAVLSRLGNYAEAQEYFERAFEIRKSLLGLEHTATLSSMANLAEMLSNIGEREKAKRLNEKAFEIRKRVLGPEHPGTLVVMANLALDLGALGENEKARRLNEQVFEIRKRVLGSTHLETLGVMGALARSLRRIGDYAAIQTLQRQAVEVSAQVLNKASLDSEARERSISMIAQVVDDLGDSSGWLMLQEEVLESLIRELGPEHPETLTFMKQISWRLQLWADPEHPETLTFMKQISWRPQILADHPGAQGLLEVTARGNFAQSLYHLGDLEGAADLQRQVLESSTRLLGGEHPQTLTARGNLAQSLYAQRDLEGAADLQRQVLESSTRLLGAEHPQTLRAQGNLAQSLYAQGDLEGAADLQRQVLESRTRLLGAEHSDTTIAAWNLFRSLTDAGASDKADEVFRERLAWLLSTERPLAGAQIQIREMLQEMIAVSQSDKSSE